MVRDSFRDTTILPVFFVLPRDPQFSATPVLASDVIHAQSKDLPRIFRVSAQDRIGPASTSFPCRPCLGHCCISTLSLCQPPHLHMLFFCSHHELATQQSGYVRLCLRPLNGCLVPSGDSQATTHLSLQTFSVLTPGSRPALVIPVLSSCIHVQLLLGLLPLHRVASTFRAQSPGARFSNTLGSYPSSLSLL